MTIEWDEELHSCGDATIDEQHQGLIDQLNLLMEGAGGDWTDEDARRLFDFLECYLERHLVEEEQLMEATGCPAADLNRREHMVFRAMIGDFRQRFLQGGARPEVLAELRGALVDWFSNHIQGVDRQLAAYLPRVN